MEIKSVAIIGSGTMGRGIAEWFALQNCKVSLIDLELAQAESGIKIIESNLSKLLDKNKITADQKTNAINNLKACPLEQIDQNVELVIEAIYENLEAKQNLFNKLDKQLNEDAIIASNTSSFPITQLASGLTSKRKMNFLGLHFFNPATIMKLVEVIDGLETNPIISKNLYNWFNSKGKVACLCKDSPGFIVNRVARNFYGEALRSAKNFNPQKFSEIDSTIKGVGGFKMGPFELMDLIGIDINYSVTQSVYHAFFDEPRFKPHRLQKEMVDANRLGKKTNKGFYNYES